MADTPTVNTSGVNVPGGPVDPDTLLGSPNRRADVAIGGWDPSGPNSVKGYKAPPWPKPLELGFLSVDPVTSAPVIPPPALTQDKYSPPFPEVFGYGVDPKSQANDQYNADFWTYLFWAHLAQAYDRDPNK